MAGTAYQTVKQHIERIHSSLEAEKLSGNFSIQESNLLKVDARVRKYAMLYP